MLGITSDWSSGYGVTYKLPFNLTLTWHDYEVPGSLIGSKDGVFKQKVLEIRWEKRKK